MRTTFNKFVLLCTMLSLAAFSLEANASLSEMKDKIFTYFKHNEKKSTGVFMNTQLTIFSETNPEHVLLHTTNRDEIRQNLKEIGIVYEVWPIDKNINAQSTQEQILAAYAPSIQKLITEGGYQSHDVIALNSDHPDKTSLRKKFLSEHTHAEDEVRFFVAGGGLFTVHKAGRVYNI